MTNERRTVSLRVFALDVEVSVPAARQADIQHQWEWCAPEHATQRSIAALSSTDESGRHLEPGPETSSPIEEPLRVERCDDLTDDVHVADYTLTTALTGRAIGARAGTYIMLHAGGVCDTSTGVVAGLVAASGTGKTTATRHFCSNGYGYVTDETLIFNDAGDVLPYPKPLSVLVDPTQPGVKTQHSPGDLGLALPKDGPLRLGPIILLDRIRDEGGDDADGAGDESDAPTLTSVDLFDGLAEVLPQSSAMPQIPGCLDVLARAAAGGGGFLRLRYRDIHETDSLLAQSFSAAPLPVDWRHVPGTWAERAPGVTPYLTRPPTDDDTAGEDITGFTSVRLAPFVDALVHEEDVEAFALFGATPAILRGIGGVLFVTLLDGPRTVDDLVTACTDTLGAHPEAASLVRGAVDDLIANGVLERHSA